MHSYRLELTNQVFPVGPTLLSPSAFKSTGGILMSKLWRVSPDCKTDPSVKTGPE